MKIIITAIITYVIIGILYICYDKKAQDDKMKIQKKKKYKVITLCGSRKFTKEFICIYENLTLEGNIVMPIFTNNLISPELVSQEKKELLDDMHLQKIEMADEIYVVNPDGYIGEGTKREIAYAEQLGKPIEYYE